VQAMFRFIVAVFGFLAAFAATDSGRAAQDAPQGSQSNPAEEVKLTYSAWTRSCTRDADVDGKQICFAIKTGRIASGQLAVAAILVEREGESRKTLRVVLPLGVQTVHGTRVIVDSEQPLQSAYLFCATDGCVSDYDVPPDFIGKLRNGKTLFVQAINSSGAPLSLPLPLADFNNAYGGNATDWSSFDDQPKTILTSLFRIKNEAGQQAANPPLIYAPWTKFCLRGQDANARQVCFIGKDGWMESGQPLIAAVVIEPEDNKGLLRVTLPLGTSIAAGTRVMVDSSPPVQSIYVICFINGCMSDYQLTPELLASLRNGRSLTVQAVENTGRLLSMALPLAEFNAAYDGPPTDPKVFEAQQKKLQEEIKQRASAPREQVQSNPPGHATSPRQSHGN
jgi:invasion protein IalB